jgi:hydroxymethylbilane synthase
VNAELVEITTQGDVQQQGPIAGLGLQGVFTKEIQAAVVDGRADVAVHSLKDLPSETVPNLVLAAVPEREECFDVLVSASRATLAELPPGARIGTGSLRRQAQLRHQRPDVEVTGIRGNVDTRLRKLNAGEFDAIVLAAAGLNRLGLSLHISEHLTPPRMLPAPGQGALGIECRIDDAQTRELLTRLQHPDSRAATDAERAMMTRLQAGCSAPLAAWGRVADGLLQLEGLVSSLDGLRRLHATASGPCEHAEEIGQQVAQQLLDQGAAAIIGAARTGNER